MADKVVCGSAHVKHPVHARVQKQKAILTTSGAGEGRARIIREDPLKFCGSLQFIRG
jgi:hypothetical protein